MQTILVIEDDRAIRGAVVDILELEGYRVLSAADGLAGVALALEERPTLIVCDIMMPYLDGYGVLTHLRKHPETATIPLIFLTARSTPLDVREGMNLGADDYLTKPFRAEELLQTIHARLERQARLAEKLQGRINELHNNLLSVLPHELNTPLHGILAGVEFLREELASMEPADIEEVLWMIQQSALRMRRLVSNTLLHSDLEAMLTSSDIEMETALPTTKIAITMELVIQQEAAAATRETDVHAQIEDAAIRILPVHLSKILEEILNNAFKYSKPGTPIEIDAVCVGRELCVTIKDYGRGMSGDEIAAISAFRQFQRKRYEQQGLGLGLVIAQRLLELYQGRLEIASSPEEYTSVCIVLPVVTAETSPQ